MFFEANSPFVVDATTGGNIDRLNARYDAIITPHVHLFDGKRVLDIGCHDGRWMHALLSANAAHVTGVEGRYINVHRCAGNLHELGYLPDRFELLHEDVEQSGVWSSRSYDVVMMLGVLYHVLSPLEMLRRAAKTGASTIIVDTAISLDNQATVQLVRESTVPLGNGLTELVSHPSSKAISLTLEFFGYDVSWRQISKTCSTLADYKAGKRVIVVARKRD